jgi:hypothetical protein
MDPWETFQPLRDGHVDGEAVDDLCGEDFNRGSR